MKHLDTYSPIEEFRRLHVRPNAGRTLIVGSFVTPAKQDRRQAYHEAIGVDMRAGPGVDLVLNLEEETPQGQFAHVECWSVLEHCARPWLMAANIESLMLPGATLHVEVPFVWGLHSYPDDCYRFTTSGIRNLFPGIEWKAMAYSANRLHEGKKTRRIAAGGQIWIERTEVLAFGVKR